MPKKINIIIRLQHWIDSVPGQTFLNYAYSWGAAIVILAALFKLTHMKGGNLMLFIGMGTEVVVFFLSAFDRPFDREEIGKELPKDYQTDEEIEADLEQGQQAESSVDMTSDDAEPVSISLSQESVEQTTHTGVSPSQPVMASSASSQPIYGAYTEGEGSLTEQLQVPQDENAQQLANIIRLANDELLHRAQAVLSPEMEAATKTYIEKLNMLNDTLERVDQQNLKLTKDSEEMENLNRTLTGINKVYELHLKSISLQVGTIDEINKQTQTLAEQIQRLNQVYGRMIEALTVNMAHTGHQGVNPPTSAE